jgi:ubiquinone/menaquinone biosynthesis C-methylase UbiE
VARLANICAGPYGPIYDFCIEREWLMRPVARLVWGIDMEPLYASMDAIGEARPGDTILDVPCGGGIALRALGVDQDVRYVAGDLLERMLGRAKQRAKERGLGQVEFIRVDMQDLPFADDVADLFLSYSGLHMVEDAESAVREIGRCLKPGGKLVGCTLLSEGARRQRVLFSVGRRLGHATPPRVSHLRRWLSDAGIVNTTIHPDRGLSFFSGTKRTAREP